VAHVKAVREGTVPQFAKHHMVRMHGPL
jgi:hypothetical protein